MARNKETAKAQVYLDGKQAEAVIDTMREKAKNLRKELKEAFNAGNTESIAKIEKELKTVEQATRSLKSETFDYQKILKNLNGSSWTDINKALKTAQKEFRRMKETDAGYKEKEAEVIKLKTKIAELNSNTRATTSIWSRMANGANKYMGIITAGIATITGVGFSVAQFIKGLTGLDDALANVQKTTGMARNEVRELYGEFKTLNTRTSKSVLLEYAEEAGRLGKKGKKDVLEFVNVANKIGTALGDDLGNAPEAIREVGKLVNIYKVGNQYNVGFGESMEKIGSAINEVAANSSASAPYQIEYLKRLSGTAKQAGITADQILGYSSVLDQNGQAVEMAATAQGKLMIDMFTKPGEYAEIAGMKVQEFTKLLETDANEAFLKFLEGINGNNEGFSKMAVKLSNLGVDGARAVQVLTTLASNTGNIRKEQLLANKAMEEGVSLTNEYNIKNNNLAGSWEKLTKAVKAKFINSELIGFMEKLISRAAKLTEFNIADSLRSEQIEVNSLIIQLRDVNIEEGAREQLLTRLKEIAPDVATAIDSETTSVQDLSTAIETYNKNMALKILMAEQQAKIEKQKTGRGGVEDYSKLAAESEALLIKEMNNSLEWFKRKGPEYVEQVRSILVDGNLETVQKAEKIDSLAGRVRSIGITSLFQALDSYKKFKAAYHQENRTLKQMIEDSEALMEEYKKIVGAGNGGIINPDNLNPEDDEEPDGGIIEAKRRTIEVINEEISTLQKEQKALAYTAEVYQQYQDKIIALEKERDAITGNKKENKELEAEKKRASDLLQEYETYLEKRTRLQTEYEDKRQALIKAGGTMGNLAVLNNEEQQKLQEIDKQILEKQAGFEKWANQMTKMGLDSLTQALTRAQAALIANTFSGHSEEELAALRAKIEAMKEQIKALKEESDTADDSKKKWRETVRVMNDVHQNVQNIISQFQNLDETTQLALSAAMNIAGGVIAMITGITALSTAAASSIRAVEAASVILAIIGAALQIIMAIYDFAFKQHDKKSNQEIEDLGIAIDGLKEKYIELDRAVGKTFGRERQRNIELQKKNLENQRSLLQRQIEAEKDKKKPDAAAIAEWEGEINDIGRQIEDLPSLADTLLGDDLMSAVQSFSDAWVDAWQKGDDMIKAQEELVDDMIANVIASLLSEHIQDAVDYFRTVLASAWEDEIITDAERKAIEEAKKEIYAKSEHGTELLEQSGLKQDIEEKEDADIAAKKEKTGFSSMTQESANELNGRFTALQGSNEVIKLATIKIGSVMEDMKGLQLTIHSTLLDIKDDTSYLPLIEERLGKIEKYFQEA